MKKLLACMALPLLAACPGGPARPINDISADAIRQPVLNICDRHDWYVNMGFAPPVLVNGQWQVGKGLSQLEQSTWLNETAILRGLVLDAEQLPTPAPSGE